MGYTDGIARAARDLGLEVRMEPQYGRSGQIVLPDGRVRYFRGTFIDLNTLGAMAIANDKAYAAYFLGRLGHPVVRGRAFYNPRLERRLRAGRDLSAAKAYAERLGYPVIAKPNGQGQGVEVHKVESAAHLARVARRIYKVDPLMLVQRYVQARDYRLVVLDGDIVSAYERVPLHVTGDGRSTILQLIKAKQSAFRASGRPEVIDVTDPRLRSMLRRQGLTLRSVPDDSVRIQLLPNANLSNGGESVDVTDTLHPTYKDLARRATRDMNLRLCGLDLLSQTPVDEPAKKGRHWILEVNARPGIDNYAASGPRQAERVEELYRRVVRAMTRRP